jgi:hypothetical protein
MTSRGRRYRRRSAGLASRISPASGVGRVVIVRIKALAAQLGRSPGVAVEQLEPTVVGHVHRGVGRFPSCWPGSIRRWTARRLRTETLRGLVRSRTASLRWTRPPTASGCCVPKQVSKRRNARQFASPLGQGKRCSALAFCARSRISKVREIGRYGAVFRPPTAHEGRAGGPSGPCYGARVLGDPSISRGCARSTGRSAGIDVARTPTLVFKSPTREACARQGS